MTTLTPAARALLGYARTALEPTPADEERVQAQLLATFAALPPACAPLPATAPAPSFPAPSRRGVSASLSRWLRGAGLVSLGLTAGGLVGYQLGFSRAQRTPAPVAAVIATAGDNAMQDPQRPREPAPALNPGSEDPALKARGQSSASPKSPSVLRRAPKPYTPTGAAQATNEDEIYQVQRVERALRQGNAKLALSLLDELDTSAARGRLHQERAAARLLAHCMLRDPTAPQELKTFEQQHPDSVHLNRLIQVCSEK